MFLGKIDRRGCKTAAFQIRKKEKWKKYLVSFV
jgi:hypothetical protein